jgi:diguanylate cyclase (GGDEF)-like protein
MTLYHRLLIFITVLFLGLFCAVLFVKVQVTRSFLESQLESHAQDTATSLGLSIAPHLTEGDMATIETMMNAIFDRGYYQSILLTDLDDRTLVERRLTVVIEQVPAWFVNIIPLSSPEARVIASSGWKQIGHLIVTSHPGYAYQALWRTVTQTAGVFTITGIIALLIGIPVLRLLFSPLRTVEAQANALCRKQYAIQDKLPKTKELRQVVIAMNAMVTKVKTMFEDQAAIAEELQKNAYTDPLTGIGNRRYLEACIQAAMKNDTGSALGAFLLVEIHNLTEINRTQGYEKGDQLLRQSALLLQKAVSSFTRSTVARISGATMAVFLEDATEAEAGRVAKTITEEFSRLPDTLPGLGDNIGNVGGICYEEPVDTSRLLAEADRLLRKSQSRGPNNWQVESISEGSLLPRGERQWIKLFEDLCKNVDIVLLGQKVFRCDAPETLLHFEVLARIAPPGGELLKAETFIPMAEQLQCVATIDKIVIEKALALKSDQIGAAHLAVNISASSLGDPLFTSWVCDCLQNRATGLPEIIFEFSEFATSAYMEALKSFSKNVKLLGGDIAIDHFGGNYGNIGYLNSLQPKYVKIDRTFTEEIENGRSDTLFYIKVLTGAVHSLDIIVIAEGVENVEQLRAIRDLHIDGMQGFYCDKPKKILQPLS